MAAQKTILIVEDEKALVEVLQDKLSNEGYLVKTAFDGQQGLDQALKHKPDLILLDIVMPVVDGFDMLEELRQDPWGKSAQVVLMTNIEPSESVDTDHIQSQATVENYVVKSNKSLKEIIATVKQLV